MQAAALQAVIFDLDGVLVSTDEQHYLAWKALADRLSIPFDRSVNNRFRGVSRMACMDILETLSGRTILPEDKCRYAQEKNERYRALLQSLSPRDLDPSVKETLDALHARGLRLAVGSSSRNAKFILDRVGLAASFDAVSDGTNIQNSKPNPEVFQKAALFLGVAPQLCMVVEDACSGIEAAKAADMLACGMGDAKNDPRADYRIDRIEELQALLLERR